MTDIVDELFESDAASALTNRAAREIARLRDELKGWEAWRSNVLTEHTQIANGLREDLKLTQGQRNASNREIERLRDQLAAAQDATRAEQNWVRYWHKQTIESQARESSLRQALMKDTHIARKEALASPSDDTALRERLAAERERVIAAAKARYDHEVSAVAHHTKQYDAYDWHMTRQAAMADMLDAIRALGDE